MPFWTCNCYGQSFQHNDQFANHFSTEMQLFQMVISTPALVIWNCLFGQNIWGFLSINKTGLDHKYIAESSPLWWKIGARLCLSSRPVEMCLAPASSDSAMFCNFISTLINIDLISVLIKVVCLRASFMNIKKWKGGGRFVWSLLTFLLNWQKMERNPSSKLPTVWRGVAASPFLWSPDAFSLLSLEVGCLSAFFSVCMLL